MRNGVGGWGGGGVVERNRGQTFAPMGGFLRIWAKKQKGNCVGKWMNESRLLYKYCILWHLEQKWIYGALPSGEGSV